MAKRNTNEENPASAAFVAPTTSKTLLPRVERLASPATNTRDRVSSPRFNLTVPHPVNLTNPNPTTIHEWAAHWGIPQGIVQRTAPFHRSSLVGSVPTAAEMPLHGSRSSSPSPPESQPLSIGTSNNPRPAPQSAAATRGSSSPSPPPPIVDQPSLPPPNLYDDAREMREGPRGGRSRPIDVDEDGVEEAPRPPRHTYPYSSRTTAPSSAQPIASSSARPIPSSRIPSPESTAYRPMEPAPSMSYVDIPPPPSLPWYSFERIMGQRPSVPTTVKTEDPVPNAVAASSSSAVDSSSSAVASSSSSTSSRTGLHAYTCPICFSKPQKATLTPCGHVLCGLCLFTAIKTSSRGVYGGGTGPRCPVCRADIPGWDGRGGGVIGLQGKAVIAL